MKNKSNLIIKINNKIKKLNKTTIFLIVFIYAILLAGIYGLISTSKPFVNVPAYNHQLWNSEINPQITVIANRRYNDSGNVDVTYSINTYTYGRINSESTADPGYTVKNFKLSAATTKDIKTEKIDDMYYFTEHQDYTTPTTHNYTLDCSDKQQHPYQIYTQLEYKKSGQTKIESFKEVIQLYPTATDKGYMNFQKDLNSNSSLDYFDDKGIRIANLQFIQTKNEEGDYNCSVKITMYNLSYESKYHIDMQSWIEDESGDFFPFIGVYGYSNQKSNYTQSNKTIDHRAKAKYICAKFTYYANDTFTTKYFKAELDDLENEFSTSTSPYDGQDDNGGAANNKILKITIAATVSVIGCAAIVYIVVIYNKKRKENSVSIEEENNDKQKN